MGIFRTLFIPLVAFQHYRKGNLRGERLKPLNKGWLQQAGRGFGKLRYAIGSNDRLAQEALGWILKRQTNEGTWYTIYQALMNLMALQEAQDNGIGSFQKEIDRGFRGLLSWRGQTPDGQWFMQQIMASGWDTPQTVIGLNELPDRKKYVSSAVYHKAVDFIVNTQVRVKGDWAYSTPQLVPGGWSFDPANPDYPDSDVATANLEALLKSPQLATDPRVQRAFIRGHKWVMALQNSDGGFPAWEKGTSSTFNSFYQMLFDKAPDFSDLGQTDVTGRILKYLAHLKHSRFKYLASERVIQKACKFMLKNRSDKKKNLWEGRWLVAFSDGTAEATDALLETGCWNHHDAWSSLHWLYLKQGADGGWGEDHQSFIEGRFIKSQSTVMLTTYAIQPFLTYERLYRQKTGKRSPFYMTLVKAMKFLMAKIPENGLIRERSFSGVIAKKLWYANYALSPQYMTLRAFGRYLQLPFAANY